MPPNNCDPEPYRDKFAFDDHRCPKCGTETESIRTGAEGPPVENIELCPACYLVTWSDKDGLHLRQGTPVKKGEGGSQGLKAMFLSQEPHDS